VEARPQVTGVAAVFPEPTPYRAPLLDRIAKRDDIDLTVIYASETVAGRTWEVKLGHRHVVLSGVRLPGARRLFRHDYPLTPGIWRALSRAKPQVVVISGWSTFVAQASVAWCRAHRVPYLLVVESHDRDPRPGWRRAVKGAFVPRVVGGAEGVLVTGTLARESMLARGSRPDRLRIFANTVDVHGFGDRADRLADQREELRDALGLRPTDVVILYVGRLAAEKGIDTLVEAAAEADHPDLALLLVGDGPERERLVGLVERLGVHAAFAGDRPWDRIVEAYVAADVFALLSRSETWGVVVNEAAACGLPLLLSDSVGAAHDLVFEDENGYRIPAGDVRRAAEALRALADDPDRRLRYGAASRRIAAQWGYEPSVESFVRLVQEAV
jgi:glycosyltransferase involved in cell wall biosynthesis